ncbi:MAG: NAD-dependent epimerase/dehydratase family protein [Paracoccus sp. (in: a-proteobacteria)]|uniref:NAD-dependent epimerase/dehydratase family protein n=1 Tax=Paracoccus sp. TaxID=267 RepID=UPI0026DFFEBB|nr:NAD-dependent epimerase/dehydratase family protein [Paracoccus sp. (in: a-proteobacteria)]MDO5620272.1 NAD-dependent epimerase/dehydratase family protein [Paracoccus sp. (in: a-proteobacteria)]
MRRVVVLDDLSTGHRHNIPEAAEFVEGSILDAPLVDQLVARSDGVFHLAALVSVQDCIADWQGGHRTNLGATISIMQAAARHGGKPVIYASSAAIYGDQNQQVCTEQLVPSPISPYGADKLGCEHQARAFAVIHGLPSVGLRFFNVYGPRQDPRSPYAGVISKFCDNLRKGVAHTVFGDGMQSRDFVYVGDIVAGLIAARDFALRSGGAEVANLCTGKVTTLLDLIATLDTVAAMPASAVNHAAARPGDIRFSMGSPAHAADLMNWSASVGLEQGLREFWRTVSDN